MKPLRALVTGASGYLGHEVLAECGRRGLAVRELGRAQGFDLDKVFELEEPFAKVAAEEGPGAVLLHLAAMSRWRACDAEPDRAFRVNTEATGVLASVFARQQGRTVYASTDLVFDGERAPYDERVHPRPLSVYGKSKRYGEIMTLASDKNLVVRLPLLYGPSFDGARGASDSVLRALARDARPTLFTDEWRTPLLVSDAARRLVDLALDRDEVGVRHLPGPERLSRYELGARVVREAGLDPARVVAGSRTLTDGSPRPRDCSLAELPVVR